jgi:hypothetical protein
LQAAIVTLSVRNRISRRDVVELCEQLFSSRISTGTIDAILTRAGDALAEPYADLLDRVRSSHALNIDETGWRLKGAQRALWGAFTDRHAVFAIAPSRHEDHARDLLADSTAIVTSDRWWAYGHLPVKRRQVCWSHLQRDFAAHAVGLAADKHLGEAGLKICDELFWAWEIYQHTGDRGDLKRHTRKLRRELKAILNRHAAKAALPLHPALRAQPAEDLAGTVDLRRDRWRAADQQPRRTRTARRSHRPQAEPRQPVRRRRTTHRAIALGAHDLPPATPLAARLPRRSARCSRPRRSDSAARLTHRHTERLPEDRHMQVLRASSRRPPLHPGVELEVRATVSLHSSRRCI